MILAHYTMELCKFEYVTGSAKGGLIAFTKFNFSDLYLLKF